MRIRKALAVAGVAAVTVSLAVTGAAVASMQTTVIGSAQTVNVTAADYRLTVGPHAPVTAGLVRLRLTDRGHLPHMALIFELNRGITYARFSSVLKAHGSEAAIALTTPAGGANSVMPAASQTTWQYLGAGQYVIVCLMPAPDGRTHLGLGMLARLQVRPSPQAATSATSTAGVHVSGVITAHNMTFTLPARIAGHGVYQFRDTDRIDTHELSLLRLLPGKSAADVAAWFKHPGSPPFTFAGGFGAVLPGNGGYLRLNLPAGNYVATCFVPDDAAPHTPHGAMGMIVPFTVR